MTTELVSRDALGHFLPGNQESKGKRTSVSLVRTMKEDLEEHPEKIIPIWENLYQLSVKPDFRALEAIDKIFDRLDGKTATDVHIRGIIAHIGEEYTGAVLRAVQQVELERQNRLLLAEKAEE